jgi:hypothetical protein
VVSVGKCDEWGGVGETTGSGVSGFLGSWSEGKSLEVGRFVECTEF